MHDNHFPSYIFLIGTLMDMIFQIIITKVDITSNSNTKEHGYTKSAIISNDIRLILCGKTTSTRV